MPSLSPRRSIALVLGGGLALRLVLAFVVFPDQGFASDISLFHGWAADLVANGPSAFYASDASANYPPGYMYVLWLIGSVAAAVGPTLGMTADHAILEALKLPAIAADIGIGWLLFLAARRWIGPRAGLAAAALYLFVPVTWYDSALWGQVDAVGTFLMLAAILLLIDGWSEAALTVAALGILVKPQAFVALVVIVPVLVRRHLLRPGSGPAPVLGPRLARLNTRLGGLLMDQGPKRLASSALLAGAALIVPLLPFDIDRFAPASVADLPVIGKVAGLAGLFQSVADAFSVLTANAYNLWALVGPSPLSTNLGGSGGSWTSDSIVIVGGIPAVLVGAGLLAGVCLLVAAGLLLRDSRLHILVGFTLLAFAFYALPTRVHERYLFPAFASAALLAVQGLTWAGAYLGVGALNAINLHAILAGGLNRGGGGGSGGGQGGGPVGGNGVSSIHLPFADLFRSEPVVTAVALGQSLAFVALLGVWIAIVVRPDLLARLARRRTAREPQPASVAAA